MPIHGNRTELLNLPVSKLDWTIRAFNFFTREHIKSIKDLVRLTPDRILGARSGSRKVLQEISAVLEAHGLTLGMEIDLAQSGEDSTVHNLPFREISVERFFIRVADLDLSTRANHFLSTKGIGFVGQLVQVRVRDVLMTPGYFRKTVKEFQEALKPLQLSLDMKLEWWRNPSLSDIEASFRDEIKVASNFVARRRLAHKSSDTLETELLNIASMFSSGRNFHVVLRRFGWDGRGGASLEIVGNEFGGITRERVRQICAAFEKTVRKKSLHTPILDRAIAEIDSQVPCSKEHCINILRECGLVNTRFEVEGIAFGADIFRKRRNWTAGTGAASHLVLPKGAGTICNKILSIAKKEISSSGVASLDEIAAQTTNAY